jgi:acid phosphatase
MAALHICGLRATIKKPSALTAIVAALTLSIIGTMAPWLYTAATVGLVAFSRPTAGASGNDGKGAAEWHAPSKGDVNDLDKALHSEGVYGFIFDSSHTPDEKYGTYNYCNMPHVRRKEYVKPDDEYELQYVELVSPPFSFALSVDVRPQVGEK